MENIKVVGIGLNKTGTTTLAECLRILGYKKHVSFRRDLLAEYRQGRLENILRVIEENDSFEDWPFPLMYREIFFRLGNRARYVLTKRVSASKWLESLKRHSLRTLPDQHSRLLAYGYNYPHGVEQHHLDFYERHCFEVLKFFEHHNSMHLLLEVSWDGGDGWNRLCEFLDKPIPESPFPHEKRGSAPIPPAIEFENRARIAQQLSLLGIESGGGTRIGDDANLVT
jgi:hypothetical protein